MSEPVPVKKPEPFKVHTADANRQKRRALMKILGKRQFKKLYRGAQV